MALSLLTRLEASDYKQGYCPVTGKKIISQGKVLDGYAIALFELENGSRMPVAVHKRARITEDDFDKITEHVEQGWMYEMEKKKWSDEQIQNYKNDFFNVKIKKVIE